MKRTFILWLVAVAFALCGPLAAYGEEGTGAPETIGLLLGSRANRAFLGEPVDPEDLRAIVRCGVQAPSARNGQPWHFTVVTNREIASQIVGDTNGAVIVISGAERGMSTEFDCGLATHAMYTAAQALGLGANIYLMPVAKVNASMRETLSIPEGYSAVMVMCVGKVAADAVTSASQRDAAEELSNFID